MAKTTAHTVGSNMQKSKKQEQPSLVKQHLEIFTTRHSVSADKLQQDSLEQPYADKIIDTLTTNSAFTICNEKTQG